MVYVLVGGSSERVVRGMNELRLNRSASRHANININLFICCGLLLAARIACGCTTSYSQTRAKIERVLKLHGGLGMKRRCEGRGSGGGGQGRPLEAEAQRS